ncbi:MAG TPA: hypothetical protein VK425_04550, partial [Acidimicrobiales bacterium]|nr:hypothetical protein [Acidimicrobiales bacterium]
MPPPFRDEGQPARARLSEEWARLREDTALKGRDWSKATGTVTDAWLRDVFDLAVAKGAPGAPGQPAAGTGSVGS